MTALFTRQEYNTPVTPGRNSKMGLANCALISGPKGGFWRINDDSRLAADIHRLIYNGMSAEAEGLYSVSASAQGQHSEERDLTALHQIHLRQDVSVRVDGRWNAV